MEQEHSAGACVVHVARQWLGTPYQHQASLKGVGADCLGLIRGIWRELEGSEPEPLPAYSAAWSEVNAKEALLDVGHKYFCPIEKKNMQSGDVVAFRLRPRSAAKHLGILSDKENFIHAYDGNAVVESALSSFWSSRIVGVFRFPCIHKLR